jgi:hypothetical protein
MIGAVIPSPLPKAGAMIFSPLNTNSELRILEVIAQHLSAGIFSNSSAIQKHLFNGLLVDVLILLKIVDTFAV